MTEEKVPPVERTGLVRRLRRVGEVRVVPVMVTEERERRVERICSRAAVEMACWRSGSGAEGVLADIMGEGRRINAREEVKEVTF